MMETDNHRVGLLLCLHIMALHKLACYIILADGSDGSRVAFAASEYVSGKRGALLDGVVVCLVVVYCPEYKNRMARRLNQHNCGYAIGKIIRVTN